MSALHKSILAAATCTALTGVAIVAGPAGSVSAFAATSGNSAAAAAGLQAYEKMTPVQRIGQLFMVGGPVTGLTSATTLAISRYHVGNLILTGRATAGAPPVRSVTSASDVLAGPAATAAVPLFIATDQEGGYVQVLQGSGFSRMPTALTQGTWPDSTLTSNAVVWGRQVLQAGVDVNLAPVMDTVSQSFAPHNPPIGWYYREYGYTPATVADKGTAFLRGMRSAGLAMTAKHFPGLGLVTGNTDTTAGVTDTVTTRSSSDITPFRAAVTSGSQFLMVSSAVYSKIDAHSPAVFSPTVITGMIRGDLGFTGVVISDDLGNAKQVQAWSPGARAVDFINAGGDMVLTVNPTVLPAMVDTINATAISDAAFRAKVNIAAWRVLTVKAAQGLLEPRLNVDGLLRATTITALQRWLGVTQTAQMSAATIRALQARVGTSVDGAWGPNSMAALQSYLGTYRDGAPTWNTRTVSVLQQYLNTQL